MSVEELEQHEQQIEQGYKSIDERYQALLTKLHKAIDERDLIIAQKQEQIDRLEQELCDAQMQLSEVITNQSHPEVIETPVETPKYPTTELPKVEIKPKKSNPSIIGEGGADVRSSDTYEIY